MNTTRKYSSVYDFLWQMIKPYKWLYAAMLSAPILSSLYDFANNYALKLVVDAFSEHEEVSFSDLSWPIGLFIFAQIMLDVIWRAADIAEWRSEPYVRQAILNHVYGYVQEHPYPFFQNTPSGTITSRIKGILDGYDHFWAAMHHDFTPRIANTVILTASLAIVNIQVCLFIAVWGIVFFAAMYKLSITSQKLSYNNANYRHHVLGLIADNISNIFTVFSFAAKKSESAKLNIEISNTIIPANIKYYKFEFKAKIVAAVLYWSMLIFLFLFMIYLRQAKQASSGDMVFVMGITLKMSFELWQLIQKMQEFMKNVGDMKSAFEIMNTPHDETELKAQEILTIKKPSVELENLSFFYDQNKPVFKNLSLAIKPGEKIGLVGVSGAGKSSMVSLLLKYFSPQQGHIIIGGQDIKYCTADSVRENIALIPQDIMLFHRSILGNICYGKLTATKEEVINAARMANIHDFIMSLPDQYDSMVGERGIKLSGGQRQRIAIARAILKNAPILILDEATSSLDTETEQLIQASLQQLLNNSTTTVIAIAHRLSTIKHMDRIIVLEHGKIIEEGLHEKLLQSGRLYQKLWEMQKI